MLDSYSSKRIVKVIVDYRERRSGIVELLSQALVEVEVKPLKQGDFIINHSITIERKTGKDFIISLMNGRLFRQASRLKRFAQIPILLLEGNPYPTDIPIAPSALKGAIISLNTHFYLPIIYSRHLNDTVNILKLIGSQQTRYRSGVLRRSGSPPKDHRNRQLYLLQGLPEVGPILAKRLLNHFGSVNSILNASEMELTAVPGVGQGVANAIVCVLRDTPAV
jgi:Fanconi anemia group M protein